MKKQSPIGWLVALCGLLAISLSSSARTPTDYAWVIDGDPNLTGQSPWPGPGASVSIHIPLEDLEPGAHTASITVLFDDGYVTPPSIQKFFLEPGTTAEPSYSVWEIDGNPVLTGDSPWPGPDPSASVRIPLGELEPGAYTASVSVLFADGLKTPPTIQKVFVEPDAQASLKQSLLNPFFELLDESGTVIFSDYLEKTLGTSGLYTVYLPEFTMNNLYDVTLRPRLRIDGGSGATFLSSPNASQVLYRQQNYYDWMEEVAPGRQTDFYLDVDGDQMTNILEWFLKTNPTEADSGPKLEVGSSQNSIVFSWTGRGGIPLEYPGFYNPAAGGEFGLQHASNGLRGAWAWGLPAGVDGTSVFETRRIPLDGGLERIEVVIPINSPEAPEGTFFLRWAPASDF